MHLLLLPTIPLKWLPTLESCHGDIEREVATERVLCEITHTGNIPKRKKNMALRERDGFFAIIAIACRTFCCIVLVLYHLSSEPLQDTFVLETYARPQHEHLYALYAKSVMIWRQIPFVCQRGTSVLHLTNCTAILYGCVDFDTKFEVAPETGHWSSGKLT